MLCDHQQNSKILAGDTVTSVEKKIAADTLDCKSEVGWAFPFHPNKVGEMAGGWQLSRWARSAGEYAYGFSSRCQQVYEYFKENG